MVNDAEKKLAQLREAIPKGEEKAIKRHELVRLLGISDRNVRLLIAELRGEEIILSSVKGGYYRPLPEDAPKVRAYLSKERSRALSSLKAIKFAVCYLEDMERGVFDGTHQNRPPDS